MNRCWWSLFVCLFFFFAIFSVQIVMVCAKFWLQCTRSYQIPSMQVNRKWTWFFLKTCVNVQKLADVSAAENTVSFILKHFCRVEYKWAPARQIFAKKIFISLHCQPKEGLLNCWNQTPTHNSWLKNMYRFAPLKKACYQISRWTSFQWDMAHLFGSLSSDTVTVLSMSLLLFAV